VVVPKANRYYYAQAAPQRSRSATIAVLSIPLSLLCP
jgi:hypothetical protein